MIKKSLFASAVLAVMAGASMAQTIPAPAGSVYSGASAVVGITPVDVSGLQNQINSVASTANAAYSYGTSAYNTANYAVNLANSGWTPGKVVGVASGVTYGNGGWQQVAGVCVVGYGNQSPTGWYTTGNCPAGTGFMSTEMTYVTPP